jgi:hypothetical protein
MEFSGEPVSIKMPVPAAVNHFVFCLHASNIPHYRDKYNPLGHKTIILITAAVEHRETHTKGSGTPLPDPGMPETKRQNSKHEIRNPGQYQNPNAQNSKKEQPGPWLFFLFWSFKFVSNFDIRISDLKFLKFSTFLRAKSQELRAALYHTKI